jgi:hypothetical protein
MDANHPIADIPFLPAPTRKMSWRNLHHYREGDRGEDFYIECIEYAQYLWRQFLPARAILCLDRAWGADLDGSEQCLNDWPLPYHALVHILAHSPQDVFLGNPRVHFQHYADRLGQPRKEQRKWRSWACWALACKARPDLPGDSKHEVAEPTLELIAEKLDQYGHPDETDLWRGVMDGVA